MNDYISREELLKLYTFDGPINETGVVIRQNILDMPAADAVEVRHGRWIMYIPPMYTGDALPRCSECRMTSDVKTPFCAQCGALMDGEIEWERKEADHEVS